MCEFVLHVTTLYLLHLITKLCVINMHRVYRNVCVSPAVSHIVIGRLVLGGHLDPVGQEAEDGAGPKQDGEATEQLATELDPLWCGGGRGERVGPIPRQDLHGSGVGQTLREESDSI